MLFLGFLGMLTVIIFLLKLELFPVKKNVCSDGSIYRSEGASAP